MSTELYRVESTAIAVSRGIGSEWATDHVHALGLSGIYNKLGPALLHVDGHRSAANKFVVVSYLAGELVHMAICKPRESVGDANDALEWWLDKNCPFCKGAGKNFEQIDCPRCDGSGEKYKPKNLGRVVGVMNAALEWLELQQRKRLSGHEWTPQRAVSYGGSIENGPICGWKTPERSPEASQGA